MREFLKSKIHQCRCTAVEPRYSGSVVIDRDLMDGAGLAEYEKVLICNASNGERWETYVIAGERGSGVVSMQGPCARLCQVGDELVVQAYELTDAPRAPSIIVTDEDNRILRRIET